MPIVVVVRIRAASPREGTSSGRTPRGHPRVPLCPVEQEEMVSSMVAPQRIVALTSGKKSVRKHLLQRSLPPAPPPGHNAKSPQRTEG